MGCCGSKGVVTDPPPALRFKRGVACARAGFVALLRRAAFERRLPCCTSLDTASAFLDVLAALNDGHILSPRAAAEVSPL